MVSGYRSARYALNAEEGAYVIFNHIAWLPNCPPRNPAIGPVCVDI
jgi:hypothetical protein